MHILFPNCNSPGRSAESVINLPTQRASAHGKSFEAWPCHGPSTPKCRRSNNRISVFLQHEVERLNVRSCKLPLPLIAQRSFIPSSSPSTQNPPFPTNEDNEVS
eukprot:TRINITY_DN29614_c0_g1_i1.p2 TRINITY_DN29614_c0_g1~~TRINITY_DN29614_c0_g1_i1.p2  ORF type:complete len:104 (+),score=14.62 TRINITY_DN29614_c0_g1_i1:135-446(+)